MSETPKTNEQAENNSNENLSEWQNELVNDVPSKLKMKLPTSASEETTISTITNYNDAMMDTLDDAKVAVIRSYIQNEEQRALRQRPLLITILVITAIQCLFFNLIIGYISFVILNTGNQVIISQLLDILKWYIGATVVELIGMIAFVVNGTFSNGHVKTLELILNDNNTKDKKQKND